MLKEKAYLGPDGDKIFSPSPVAFFWKDNSSELFSNSLFLNPRLNE